MDTDEEELEYYDKQSLLVPAVRVQRGRVEFKKVYARFDGKKQWRLVAVEDVPAVKPEKIGKKTYYDQGSLITSAPIDKVLGGFHYGNDGWLDWYEKRGMVHYPADEEYRPWETFEGDRHFATKPEGFNEVSEMMYSKLQIFPLKYTRDSRTITISNEALFRTPLEWKHAGQKMTEYFTKVVTDELVREENAVWCRHIGFICEISKLRVAKLKAKHEAYYQAKANFDEETAQEEVADINANYETDNDLKSVAAKLMKDYGYSLTDVENIRFKIMKLGSFDYTFSQNPRREYIARLDDQILMDTEPLYGWAQILSWFIDFAGGTPLTVKQVLLNQRKPTCTVCGKHFDPKRRTQVTCSPACAKKHSLAYKKEARKTGKYKY